MKKLGIALQWALIKLRVLKSDGTKYSDGRYVSQGLRRENPLTWVFLLVFSVFAIIYGVVAGVYDTLGSVWSKGNFED